jgi:hypothetical protein
MPRISFPVSNRHIDEPILVTDIHPIRQPDADSISGRAGSLPPTIRERMPWQSMGVGVASLGIPVGIGVLHPGLGEALTVIEIVVVLTIIGTALFGNLSLSERAFRLLRWLGNRPEPPGPTSDHFGGGGKSCAAAAFLRLVPTGPRHLPGHRVSTSTAYSRPW